MITESEGTHRPKISEMKPRFKIKWDVDYRGVIVGFWIRGEGLRESWYKEYWG